MVRDPLENPKNPGNFSKPQMPMGTKSFSGEFSPPAYVALALELACQMAPYVFQGGDMTDSKIVRIAKTFRSFLESKEG